MTHTSNPLIKLITRLGLKEALPSAPVLSPIEGVLHSFSPPSLDNGEGERLTSFPNGGRLRRG